MSLIDEIRHDLSNLLSPGRSLGLCALISSSLLAGAFAFEHLGGLSPCSLCIWQRWAHVAIIVPALAGFLLAPRKAALALVFVAAMTSAAIAAYHAGVEWRLWEGPGGCTAAALGGGSASDLVDQLLATPVARCDEVAWSFLGLSMAGWNTLFSLDIAALALIPLVVSDRKGRVQ